MGGDRDWGKPTIIGGGNLSLPSAKQTGVQKRGEIEKENVKKTSKHTHVYTHIKRESSYRYEGITANNNRDHSVLTPYLLVTGICTVISLFQKSRLSNI